MNETEFKLHQGVKIWNIFASVFFAVLCVGMYFIYLSLYGTNFDVRANVSIFDILVLSLATYRLIRLFVYDNMTLFIRELFLDLNVVDEKYKYVTSKNSFKVTMSKLTLCPWCFGVWLAFVSGFLYFTFPVLQIVFVLLAISSIASFLIILTNLVGWHAEAKKNEVQKS